MEERKEIQVPSVSARAIEESRKEVEEYESRFNDASEPPQFKDKYLDVSLAVRMLSRGRRRKALLCELLAYLVLVTIYCVYLFTFVTVDGGFFVTTMYKQAFVFRPFPQTKVYLKDVSVSNVTEVPQMTTQDFDGDGVQDTVCKMPFIPSQNGSMIPSDAPRDPNASYVPCDAFTSTNMFSGIANLQDTYDWLQHLLSDPSLFPVEPVDQFIMPGRSFVPVGAIQLRQVRVNQKPCMPSSAEYNPGQSCSQPFSTKTESKEPFVGTSSGTTYTYSSAEELARTTVQSPGNGETISFNAASVRSTSQKWHGILNSYPQGGFVLNIAGGNRTDAQQVWRQLKQDSWLDSQTVALFVTFTTFSVNLQIFVAQRFVVELSPYGLVISTSETAPFEVAMENSESSALGLEATIMGFAAVLLLYFFWSLYAAWKTKKSISVLFSWIVYDILNLALVLYSVAIRTSLDNNNQVEIAISPDVVQALSSTYSSTYSTFFEAYSDRLLEAKLISSISLIVCFLKFFKYVDLNKRFSIALTTFVESRVRLAGWLVFSLVFLFAFCVYAYFSYGWFSPRFSTMGRSIESMTMFVVQIFSFSFLGSDLNPDEKSISQVLADALPASRMSWQVLEIADFPYAYFFSSNLIFTLLFVTVVAIVITNMFQAILIFGYQNVAQAVIEDEELRKEQRETMRRSREMLKQSRVDRFVKSFRDLGRYKETDLVISRLKTAPETRFRNLLSFHEVYKIISDVISSETRAEEVTFELMSLYQTQLTRIKDAVELFQDRGIALREGRDSFNLAPSELPLVRASAEFDPTRHEQWVRDLQSGDLVQSLFFVHCLQLEALNNEFEGNLTKIDLLQSEITQRSIELEGAIRQLEDMQRERSGDYALEANPWAPRQQTCIEPRIDGRFDAHHVDPDGVHRFLGTFAQASLAQTAIDDFSASLRSKEEEQQKESDFAKAGHAAAKVAGTAAGFVGLDLRGSRSESLVDSDVDSDFESDYSEGESDTEDEDGDRKKK